MYTYFGNEELNILKADALLMSHQGDCENDVRALLPKYYKQLCKKSLDNLRNGLIDCGIERERVIEMEETEVFIYVLWIVSGDIKEKVPEYDYNQNFHTPD